MSANLRCRPGDMAIVLTGMFSGAMVTVLKFYGSGLVVTQKGNVKNTVDAWYVTPPSAAQDLPRVKKSGMVVRDSSLLPIRPNDLKEPTEASKELIV